MFHLFVINPKSFRNTDNLEKVLLDMENCFSVGRREQYQIYVSRRPRDAIAAVRRYVTSAPADSAVRVYALGGDGILFDCLNGIIGLPNAELASVPYGASNDFVRAFGEGLFDEFKDIRAQALSGCIPTDVIDGGSNFALNRVHIGIEAQTMLNLWNFSYNAANFISRSRFYQSHMGMRTYISCVLALMNKNLRNQYYTLEADGQDFSGRYTTMAISNGPCQGGTMTSAPDAVPNDGLMHFIALKNNVFDAMILRKIQLYSTGFYKELSPDEYVMIKAKEIKISSDEPINTSFDGEAFVTNELNLRIHPSAIKFVNVNGHRYRNEHLLTEGGGI
ncbi:MAG: hypothetical protein LBN97_03810 [Oscillospiraceae bacterium]|jgi:diacylglycerol kinase family enzyme|nr:hypothetical protein [Oscillospiraceae bacterium]